MSDLSALLEPMQTVAGVNLLGYTATEPSKKRRSAPLDNRPEDDVLDAARRRKLISHAHDLPRNFAAAAWMLRKHCEYVSTFSFQAKTENDDFNKTLELFVEDISSADRLHISGQYDLPELLDLMERHRVLDGDVFVQKLSTGQIQTIVGDRIRTPNEAGGKRFTHGIHRNAYGRPLRFAVSDRSAYGGYKPARVIPARHMWQIRYATDLESCRGVSPLAPSIKILVDINEATDYALAKAKVSQLFALLVKTNNDPEPEENYRLSDGPKQINLASDEDAEFLESKTPSSEFSAYMNQMILLALKGLDIPYSFYAENFTNYSGSRAALLLYEQSSEKKRHQLRRWLTAWLRWRLQIAILTGEIKIPAGLSIASIRWEWMARGLPWIDPLKEVMAVIKAVDAGLLNKTMGARILGFGDWSEINAGRIREQAVDAQDILRREIAELHKKLEALTTNAA